MSSESATPDSFQGFKVKGIYGSARTLPDLEVPSAYWLCWAGAKRQEKGGWLKLFRRKAAIFVTAGWHACPPWLERRVLHLLSPQHLQRSLQNRVLPPHNCSKEGQIQQLAFLLSSQVVVMPPTGNHTKPQCGPHEATATFLQMSEPSRVKSHFRPFGMSHTWSCLRLFPLGPQRG